jgi:hypothetical protein
MKKGLGSGLIILMGFLSLCALGFGQIIENPVKPIAANAGRIIKLEEEMRIRDGSGDFFFRETYRPRVSPGGSIFIQDGQEQALQFDAEGRFIKNLFKQGQGPGELTGLFDIWASPDKLYLLGNPLKVLVFGYDGHREKEISLRGTGIGARFIRADKDHIIIRNRGRLDPTVGGGLKDIPVNIIEISLNDGAFKPLGSFPIRAFVEGQGGGLHMTAWNQLQVACFDGNNLILNHTAEYLLEVFARDKGQIVRRFRRPYNRIKTTGGSGSSGPAGSSPSAPEFLPDIFYLHVVDGKLWVQTSTVIEGKGMLFDVFNSEGRYVDNFFIQSPRKDSSGKPVNMLLTISGEFAYFSDKTVDDFIVIRKCRLVGL